MKTENYIKQTKSLLWGVAVAFVIYIMIGANAHAQELSADRTETINALTAESEELTPAEQLAVLQTSLELAGEAIENATGISQQERIMLLSQLIEISRIMIDVQRGIVMEGVVERERNFLPPADSSLEMIDLGLHRVVAKVDLDTFNTDITMYYLGEDDDIVGDPFSVTYDRATATMSMAPYEGENITFEDQMDYAREEVLDWVVDEFGLTNRFELDRSTFVTARHPKLDEVIKKDGEDARELFDVFGEFSMITEVKILPGEGRGTVILVSEHGETIHLKTIVDGKNKYSFETSYYGPIILENTIFNVFGSGVFEPSLKLIEKDIDRDEYLSDINFLFGDIPFSTELNEADERFVNYLVSNPVRLMVDVVREPYAGTGCVNPFDRLILSDYMLQILAGIQASYILDELKITFPAYTIENPTDNPDSSNERPPRCVNVTQYF